MKSLEELFDGHPALFDGAMGTMLYGRGVYINKCFDELNLSQPETVRQVHEEYLQSGAMVIETNTFGANRFRLGRYGLADKVSAVNTAGAGLARLAVEHAKSRTAGSAYVAGSVGPLGIRLEPLGKTALSEARAAFFEQIEALVAGGVDMVLVETMTSLAEAEQGVLAAKDVAKDLPVVVLFTVDEDGNCLDGSSPESAATRAAEWGADAVGANCSAGPATVLSVVERMRGATSLPLVAMPNAGMPREVDGRNIYLCSPEYMASFARKFLQAGVQMVGGCCGTTPNHIRAMSSALRAVEAQRVGRREVVAAASTTEISPEPLKDRSRIGALLEAKQFVTLVEIVPPRGINCSKEIDAAEMLYRAGVDAINVPDSPRASARMSAQSLCVQIQQQTGIETVLHYTCRDRNVLSIQSDLLGASSIGLRNILCLTGDPPKLGNYPDATAVFDVDAIGLVNIVRKLNHGLDIGNNSIGASAGFTIGVAANPGVPDLDNEIRRMEYKVEAGGEYIITQPVFDIAVFETFLQRIEDFRLPIFAGIWPLASLRNAEFMRNDLRVSVPDDVMTRMQAATSPEEAREEGVRIAQEMLMAIKPEIQGVQVSAPMGRYNLAIQVLDGMLTSNVATQRTAGA